MPGERVYLATGEAIPSRTLIWTAGIAPHPILAQLDFPRTAHGKVAAEGTLQVKECPGLWVLGGCAAVPNAATGQLCQSTAQHALRQGLRVVENLAAVLQGRDPQPYRYQPLGLLAGLGRRSAVAEILGLKFLGLVAWWLWRTVYLVKLPGWERKVRVAVDWTVDLFFPRDLVYLRPLHKRWGAEGMGTEAPAAVRAGSERGLEPERQVVRSRDREGASGTRTRTERQHRGSKRGPGSGGDDLRAT